MHRTTVVLSEALDKKLRRRAAEERKSLTQMIRDLLAVALLEKPKPKKHIELPVFHTGKPFIDLNNRVALYEFLEEEQRGKRF